MRKIAIVMTLFFIASLLLCIRFANHFWCRKSHYSIMENGLAVTKPDVFGADDLVYVRIPDRQYEEAYIIDFKLKYVVHTEPSQFNNFGLVLFSQRMPPGGADFGKLERKLPEFTDNTVAFLADNGELIRVRR